MRNMLVIIAMLLLSSCGKDQVVTIQEYKLDCGQYADEDSTHLRCDGAGITCNMLFWDANEMVCTTQTIEEK